MTWSSIKAKLSFGILLLVGALYVAWQKAAKRAQKYKAKAKAATARVDHVKKVAQGQKDNEVVYRSRTTELAKDLNERKVSRELSDVDKDW